MHTLATDPPPPTLGRTAWALILCAALAAAGGGWTVWTWRPAPEAPQRSLASGLASADGAMERIAEPVADPPSEVSPEPEAVPGIQGFAIPPAPAPAPIFEADPPLFAQEWTGPAGQRQWLLEVEPAPSEPALPTPPAPPAVTLPQRQRAAPASPPAARCRAVVQAAQLGQAPDAGDLALLRAGCR